MQSWKPKSLAFHDGWENENLDVAQIQYAANDAFASIEIFKYFVSHLHPRRVLQVPMKCFDVLGEDHTDEWYIYRSERDRAHFQSDDANNRNGPHDNMHQRNEQRQSEESSGWGLTLAAGAIALGAFEEAINYSNFNLCPAQYLNKTRTSFWTHCPFL